MTEQLCDFPTCQLARLKGFDEVCRKACVRDDDMKVEIDAPTKASNFLHRIELAIALGEGIPLETIKKILATSDNVEYQNSKLPKHFFARPTQDLLERWLREVHGIDIIVKCLAKAQNDRNAVYRGTVTRLSDKYVDHTSNFETFELACEAAIVHALKLLPDADTKG